MIKINIHILIKLNKKYFSINYVYTLENLKWKK